MEEGIEGELTLEGPDRADTTPSPGLADSDNERKIRIDENSSEKSASQKPEEDEDARTAEGFSSPRPVSSNGSIRAKSSASGDIVFEAKKKKKKSTGSADDDAYVVTFTISIAMAIPTVFEDKSPAVSQVEDEEQPDVKDVLKKKKRVFEAPKPQNYYHVEYYLTPDEDELMKTDIVTYGMAAKLYMERHDAKVIKTWQDGEITWIAWAHSHTLTVTKELLLKLYSHTLEVRVWDTKDKCSTRARYDRPKAFRLPQPKPGESAEDVGGVKAMVHKQLSGFTLMQSPKGSSVRPLPQQCAFPRLEVKKKASPTNVGSATGQAAVNELTDVQNKGLVAVPKKGGSAKDGGRAFSRLGKLAGADKQPQSAGKDSKASKATPRSSANSRQMLAVPNPPPPRSGFASPSLSRNNLRSPGESVVSEQLKAMVLPEDNSIQRRRMKKAEQAAAVAAENAKKFGICMVPFPMALLFSGTRSITERLPLPISGVEDLFITVTLDQPLLSHEQKRELNPMIITVKSITDMPDSPLGFEQLRSKCQPVYCTYQFFKQPLHTTVAKDHAKNLYWGDKNVILLGPQDPSELREYLSGPPMEVEVHDRDRKAEDVKLKPTLFGDDLEDEKISNVGRVASRRTLHNPFQGRNKPWDPYGVCKVDLSELLLGHHFLELEVPLHSCSVPDVLGLSNVGKTGGKLVGVAGAVDGPVDIPLPAGCYMKSGATLKLQIELAHPIITPDQLAMKEYHPATIQCPFGRIIFIFAYKNTNFLHQLQQLITNINALALDLADLPQHVIDAAISTYKLSLEQQTSGTLDIVTGFHVLDREKHIFVLEGLKEYAVLRLWKELPRPEFSDVRVIYNSDYSFHQRLYGPLDVDLCRVKLYEPLELVVRQSLLYVRDMVPRPCFLALTRLEEMSRMHLMKDIVKNDIFPTADMVVSMSKEFGVPFTVEDFEELRPEWEKIPKSTPEGELAKETPAFTMITSREWTPIDNYNKTYVEAMTGRTEKDSLHDFLAENKDRVKRESDLNLLWRQQTQVGMVRAEGVRTHNYSTQTLNSTELANEELRKILRKKKDTRFTRSQDFHQSGTVPLVDPLAQAKEEEEASRRLWRTPLGWIYPGKRTMLESNSHPKKPHSARVADLQEKWRENLLHVNLLQPPLDRDKFPWDYRQQDMELYIRAPSVFKEEAVSIHLPGVLRLQEKMLTQEQEEAEWRARIVVTDTAQHFHRLLPQTEMTNIGFYSSNQIDRLGCLLKDPPEKASLKRTHVRDIPPLSVVNYPSVDTLARSKGAALLPAIPGEGAERVAGYKPGPYTLSSWSMEDNRVPTHVYDHKKHAAQHGQDFNTIHTERQQLWKRPIAPLRQDERDSHLFRAPVSDYGYYEPMLAFSSGLDANSVPRVDAATTTQDLSAMATHRVQQLVYV